MAKTEVTAAPEAARKGSLAETRKTPVPVAVREPRGEVFRQFENAMLDMERRMDLLLRDVFATGERLLPAPLFHGLSLQQGPNGRLRFLPFGNLGQTLDSLREGWREPFIRWDIDDKAKVLELRAEIPGVRREDIELEVNEDCVYVEAETADHKYRAQCVPGVELNADGAKAEYQNGILTATIRLRGEARPKGKKVKIA